MPDDIPEFTPPPPPPEHPDVTPKPVASANPPPAATVTKENVLDRLGVRAARRPEPRVGVSLAGAAAAMGVVGAVAIGGDQLVAPRGGSSSQYPGVFITLGVIVVGVALTGYFRRGPLAAAGVSASAIATLPFFVFATYSSGSTPQFATILLLSSIAWGVGYLIGPGRGHALYLSAFLFGIWLWFIEATEHVFSFPTDALSQIFSNPVSNRFGGRSGPDANTIGAYSLCFAAAYLVLARVLDRRGRRGVATPFVVAGIVTLVVGITVLANELEQVGTCVAYAVAGVGLLYLGATEGRRATNWTGAILVFVGVTVIVADPFDSATAFGFAELAAAALFVLVAHVAADRWHEPAETDFVLSRFYRVGSVQPSGPPPPPAGSVLG